MSSYLFKFLGAFIKGDCPFLSEIDLVPHYENYHVFAPMFLDIVYPSVYILECFMMGDVVYKKYRM